MAERITDPLISAFLNGWTRCISKQMAGISRSQDMLQATQERHILISGQILEAIRQQTAAPPPPRSGLIRAYQRAKAAWEHFEKLHKLITVMRAVRWGSLGWTAYGGLRWLGLIP